MKGILVTNDKSIAESLTGIIDWFIVLAPIEKTIEYYPFPDFITNNK